MSIHLDKRNETEAILLLYCILLVNFLNSAQLRAEQHERQAQQPDFGGLRLKIGKFDESVDKFDSYITKFELMMDSQKVPDQIRCLHLISNLTGRSLDIVNRMSSEDRVLSMLWLSMNCWYSSI